MSKKNFLISGLSTIILFGVLIILYVVFSSVPAGQIGHMTPLRLLRSSIFTFSVFMILQDTIDLRSLFQEKQKYKLLLAIAVPFLWIALYTFFVLRDANALRGDIGSYYIIPGLLFYLLLVYCIVVSQKGHHLLSILICTFLTFVFLMTAYFFIAYFMIYGQPFDEYALLSIIITNYEESISYLTQTFSLGQIIGICILVGGTGLLLFLGFTKAICYPLNWRMTKRGCFFSIIIFCFFVHYIMEVFPAYQFLHLHRLNGPMNAFIQLQSNIEKNALTIRIKNPETVLAKKIPGTVILVVGESANRDRMHAFNPYYDKQNTPWEDSAHKNLAFSFHSKAYANFPNTVMALSQSLTSANQYNNVSLKDSVDLIDIAKQAGYHTYWFSFQKKSTVSDAGVTSIANRAHATKWLYGHDENIMKELPSIPANENNFIVIHLNGSHFRYDRAVPDTFNTKYGLAKSSKKDFYDNSLMYTDKVLENIFVYARNNLKLQAMIYFSDHGENLQYTHVASPFYYDMVRIPLWFYLSPAYQKMYPQIGSNLHKHKSAVFTNDLIFDTISGILQIDSNYYYPEYDLSNSRYAINIENAKTMHGEKLLKDDPDF